MIPVFVGGKEMDKRKPLVIGIAGGSGSGKDECHEPNL